MELLAGFWAKRVIFFSFSKFVGISKLIWSIFGFIYFQAPEPTQIIRIPLSLSLSITSIFFSGATIYLTFITVLVLRYDLRAESNIGLKLLCSLNCSQLIAHHCPHQPCKSLSFKELYMTLVFGGTGKGKQNIPARTHIFTQVHIQYK